MDLVCSGRRNITDSDLLFLIRNGRSTGDNWSVGPPTSYHFRHAVEISNAGTHYYCFAILNFTDLPHLFLLNKSHPEGKK